MKKFRVFLGILVFAAVLAGFQHPLRAQQPQPGTVNAPAAGSAVTTPALAPLAAQLGQTLQTLVGTASPQPPAAANDNGEDIEQVSGTFATDLLDALAQAIGAIKANSANLEAAVSALPDFRDWLDRQGNDPHRAALWNAIGGDLPIIVGVPGLIGMAMWLLLLPLRLNLKRHAPRSLPGRVGLLIGLFFLRMAPVFVFLGTSLLLLGQNESHHLPRFVVLNVIYALSLGYTIAQILRGLFAPTAPHLRLFSLATPQAVAAWRWFSAFNFVIVYGYFLLDVAAALRVPASAIVMFQNLFALTLTAMTIAVILQTRERVAVILRGDEETKDAQGFGLALRGWLARHWHQLAVFYLIVSLAVIWLGIANGFALMLRGTVLSTFIFAAAHYAFVAIGLWTAPPAPNAAPLLHRQMLSFLLRPVIWVAAIAGVAATWGFRVNSLIATPSGQRAAGAALSIGLTLLVLTALYEMIHAAVERYLSRSDKTGKTPAASARARTLLPMLRNSVFILFCVVAALICLSAVGINVAPLLAGAGVVGVAIGFGSQTLVKDFLTGLFIVVENTIAVGDVVKIGDFSGVVEALSIRTLRLRDSDGSLHIVPFSEVSKLTNMTRGFAYALVDVGVAYDSDLERVMNVMRDVGAQIQEDPIFKRVILEPIEVMGVQKLGDFSITIRARMRTRPGKQWDVKSLLLLRIKQRFDKEKIEMPYPTSVNISKAESK